MKMNEMDRIFLGICLPSIDMTDLCLRRQFRKVGLRALAYDIKLSTSHDLTSREGFYKLLDMGMSLVVGAVVLGGPPCSLMVGASASVHMRRTWRLLGNQANAKVRLSNAIWMNMAPMLQGSAGVVVMGTLTYLILFVFLFFRIGHFFPDFSFYSEDIYHYKMEKKHENENTMKKYEKMKYVTNLPNMRVQHILIGHPARFY
jgi:hypothetical protein